MESTSNNHENGNNANTVSPAVYFNWSGCSRWTNASKNMQIHIAKDNLGMPLCEKNYKGDTLRREPLNLSEVTCNKCLSLYGGNGGNMASKANHQTTP